MGRECCSRFCGNSRRDAFFDGRRLVGVLLQGQALDRRAAPFTDLRELAADRELVAFALPLDAKFRVVAALVAAQANSVHPGMVCGTAPGADAALPVMGDAAQPPATPAFLAAVDQFPVMVVIPNQATPLAAAARPIMTLVARLPAALTSAPGPLVSKQARFSHGFLLLAQSRLAFSMAPQGCHLRIAADVALSLCGSTTPG
jgi:hypothetical protein